MAIKFKQTKDILATLNERTELNIYYKRTKSYSNATRIRIQNVQLHSIDNIYITRV